MSNNRSSDVSSITICRTISEVRHAVRESKIAGNKIGFVPTMGALHEGHLSLMQVAGEKAECVVVSIFVNPTQFAPSEDFESYPRDLEKDIEKCERAGVSIVFCPDRDEVYDEKRFLSIRIDTLNNYMCGASRPGFFEGVLLIVNKLFNIISPDVAVFGQKDIQQFKIIEQMVAEFNHNIELVAAPIVRANDGLALSSRNAYLDLEQRKMAPGLYRALTFLEEQIKSGIVTPGLMLEHQKDELEAKGFKVDYLNLFSIKTLEPVETVQENNDYIIAGAVYVGKTRLIDNILVKL